MAASVAYHSSGDGDDDGRADCVDDGGERRYRGMPLEEAGMLEDPDQPENILTRRFSSRTGDSDDYDGTRERNGDNTVNNPAGRETDSAVGHAIADECLQNAQVLPLMLISVRFPLG
ncbi:hypothetical protein EW146_g2482 [Bondarzewia mesenterica]|uniref:Uncharacterized protein n=1 Tax=Bondarzewia mesenterica TaxID=1095465 RepID=A0A4S4M2U3_9AGAM|nr:hypothetical protein EW146_g2482 [Bondarzewia mesenterica]